MQYERFKMSILLKYGNEILKYTLSLGMGTVIAFSLDQFLPYEKIFPDISPIFVIVPVAVFFSFLVYSALNVLVQSRRILNKLERDDFFYSEVLEGEKSVFIDLMRSFEHYAKLKGYNVSFSFDTSVENKIGFKFSVSRNTPNVSQVDVKHDFDEFYEKVKKGEKFDDLTQLIPFAEHNKELLILKNKLADLELQYKLEKNLREYIESTTDKILASKNNFKVQVQIEDKSQTTKIKAKKAKQIIVGDNNIVDSVNKITISDSFNERKRQIDKINELKIIIEKQDFENKKFQEQLLGALYLLSEEMENQPSPSKQNVFNYLSTIKAVLKKVVFAHDVSDSFDWLFKTFNF